MPENPESLNQKPVSNSLTNILKTKKTQLRALFEDSVEDAQAHARNSIIHAKDAFRQIAAPKRLIPILLLGTALYGVERDPERAKYNMGDKVEKAGALAGDIVRGFTDGTNGVSACSKIFEKEAQISQSTCSKPREFAQGLGQSYNEIATRFRKGYDKGL